MKRVAADWFDGQSARRIAAEVWLDEDKRLRAQNADGETRAAALADLQISPRVADVPRRIVFADGVWLSLYVLDEPTTGLHFHDVEMLLSVLRRLVDNGNTVVVIEHNLDVIKTADWIIDLGPRGGAEGGRVMAAGAPEDIARAGDECLTGKHLRRILGGGKTLRAAATLRTAAAIRAAAAGK